MKASAKFFGSIAVMAALAFAAYGQAGSADAGTPELEYERIDNGEAYLVDGKATSGAVTISAVYGGSPVSAAMRSPAAPGWQA